MLHRERLWLLALVLTLVSNASIAQDCIFYEFRDHEGNPTALDIGESTALTLSDTVFDPSWVIVHPWAAIQVSVPNPPDNYPSMFLNSSVTSTHVWGTDQYRRTALTVSCRNAISLPQPFAWIPIDGDVTPISDSYNTMPPAGTPVLKLKRAYIYENSEVLNCFLSHGPAGSLAIHIVSASMFGDYGNDLQAIANAYCEDGCAFEDDYYLSWGNKLSGPAYSESLCPFAPTPHNEWIDGPLGVKYSNYPVFDWTSTGLNSVGVLVREGDPTNTDDFLGGAVVNRTTTGEITIRLGQGGWLVVENDTVPTGGSEPSLDYCDFYWMNKWDGNSFDGYAQILPPGDTLDQYVPLPARTINQMEAAFPTGSHIGLLGGEFPIGMLNEPMRYSAPCQVARFHD